MNTRLIILALCSCSLLACSSQDSDFITHNVHGLLDTQEANLDRSDLGELDRVLQEHPVDQIEVQPEPTCEQRISDLDIPEPTERLENYIQTLPYVVVGARIVPVLYLSWPQSSDDPTTTNLRQQISENRRPRKAIRNLVKRHRNDRELLRNVFLSQGYLFAEQPQYARALVREISLEKLFDQSIIYRQTTDGIEELRSNGEYYVDENGRRARLLLNDRVALTREELSEPLHINLDSLREQTGALRTLPHNVGTEAVAFNLVFPDGTNRPSLVHVDDGQIDLSCIGGSQETLELTLAHAHNFWTQQHNISQAARQLVAERPRFDEPINEPEDVQEDGRLRLAWRQAYRQGQSTFIYRDVEYPVFDNQGNPIPPQVCIDFVFDTWERSHGTWYQNSDAEPERTNGDVNFGRIPDFRRRSIAAVLDFAANPETPIQRFDVPREQQVPLRREVQFAEALAQNASSIREGDALVIHGLRLQDMRRHYHSVLVLRTDPLTGVPMVVADNQGRPRIGSIVTAMRAAPLRSVKHRLRVDFDDVGPYADHVRTMLAAAAIEEGANHQS